MRDGGLGPTTGYCEDAIGYSSTHSVAANVCLCTEATMTDSKSMDPAIWEINSPLTLLLGNYYNIDVAAAPQSSFVA